MAIPAKNRLRKELDFKKVLKVGRTTRGDFLFIKFAPNGSDPRFGISVSSKISKKAVIRNKIRRLLSDTIRLHALSKAKGYDTVVVATKNGLDSPGLLSQDLLETLGRAGII